MENGHRNSGFTHWKWWFSIVMLVYQRVKVLNELELWFDSSLFFQRMHNFFGTLCCPNPSQSTTSLSRTIKRKSGFAVVGPSGSTWHHVVGLGPMQMVYREERGFKIGVSWCIWRWEIPQIWWFRYLRGFSWGYFPYRDPPKYGKYGKYPPFQIFIFPYFPIPPWAFGRIFHPPFSDAPKEEHLWKIGDLMADPERLGFFQSLCCFGSPMFTPTVLAEMGSSSSPPAIAAKNIKKPPIWYRQCPSSLRSWSYHLIKYGMIYRCVRNRGIPPKL